MSKCLQSSLFTSESVAEGHPDKVADKISDSVLDAILEQDKNGRVACESLITNGLCIVAGEINANADIDVEDIARSTIREIGYTDPRMGFDAEGCAIVSLLHKQSRELAEGIKLGAGDQGLMFGYATNETPELMPMPIFLAHRLMEKRDELRKNGKLDYLWPDGKCQVTIEYDGKKPVRVHTVVLSTQHSPGVSQIKIKEDMIEQVIAAVIPTELLSNTIYKINPIGSFVNGGPRGDCGLTGRKIVVDGYGGAAPVGGGAFSGKDPSKVDRSACYAARWVAKSIVANGYAGECTVQVAYVIGEVPPLAIYADTNGTGFDNAIIEDWINRNFDLTTEGIINSLDLKRPIYKKTVNYGHFGRNDVDFTWENVKRG